MENKYREGQIVFEKKNPSTALIIRRYVDRVYYCRAKLDLDKKEFAYFERELTDESLPIPTN